MRIDHLQGVTFFSLTCQTLWEIGREHMNRRTAAANHLCRGLVPPRRRYPRGTADARGVEEFQALTEAPQTLESSDSHLQYFPCAKMTRGPFNLRDHVSNICFGLRMDLEEDFSYSDNSWYKTLRHLTDYEGCQRRPPAEPSILRNLSRHQYVRESSLRELKVKYMGARVRMT